MKQKQYNSIMLFCVKCQNHMIITEMEVESQRNIYHICPQCNYIQQTTNFNIFQKNYKQDNNKNRIKNPEFSIHDNTLPRKNTVCTSCKKRNENVFYQNNDLTITLICSNCSHQWIYS